MMKNTLDNMWIILIKDQFYLENISVRWDLNMKKPVQHAYCF